MTIISMRPVKTEALVTESFVLAGRILVSSPKCLLAMNTIRQDLLLANFILCWYVAMVGRGRHDLLLANPFTFLLLKVFFTLLPLSMLPWSGEDAQPPTGNPFLLFYFFTLLLLKSPLVPHSSQANPYH